MIPRSLLLSIRLGIRLEQRAPSLPSPLSSIAACDHSSLSICHCSRPLLHTVHPPLRSFHSPPSLALALLACSLLASRRRPESRPAKRRRAHSTRGEGRERGENSIKSVLERCNHLSSRSRRPLPRSSSSSPLLRISCTILPPTRAPIRLEEKQTLTIASVASSLLPSPLSVLLS